MDYSKKAIVLTLGDVLIDYDAAHLAVIPALMKEVLGEDLLDRESFIRDMYGCQSIREYLESYLYVQFRVDGHEGMIDPMARVLDIMNIPISGLAYEECDKMLDDELRPLQARMNQDLERFYQENSLFMPDAVEMIKNLVQTGAQVKLIHVYDERQGKRFDVTEPLCRETGVHPDNIIYRSIMSVENKDVKDLFPDLEFFNEQDIMVCSNNCAILSRSTRLDNKDTDSLRAEFHDPDRRGGPGFSRLKEAPYHISMIDYNKSRAAGGHVPSTVREDKVFKAQSVEALWSRCKIFLDGNLAISFAPSASVTNPNQESAKILSFPLPVQG